MLRNTLLALGAAAAIMASTVTMAAATEAARAACCREMGGIYGPIAGSRDTRPLCDKLGRGSQDAYYQCVQKKMSGGR